MPWISKVKKSNLTEFIGGNYIQSPSDYFATSKQNISKLKESQTIHEHRALRCIIEIGKTLSDLYDYKKRNHSPRIDKMWNDLVAEFQYSPATVTRYINISKNPILTDVRFKNRIPSSVYSLYELSKVEPIALQLLIESNEVTSTSGRTDIVALTTSPKLKKKSKIQIKIMTLSIDKKDWIKNYKTLEPDLINFLDARNIFYSLSPNVLSLDKSENTRFKKIESFAFKQSKDYFKKVVKEYVDTKCRHMHSNSTFRKKIEYLKFGKDEVTTSGCASSDEVKERLLFLGLIDEITWYKHYTRWLDLGHEEYPSEIPELDSTQSINDFSLVREGLKRTNFTPVKKKKIFTGFKV
jgi:hypothetical protein